MARPQRYRDREQGKAPAAETGTKTGAVSERASPPARDDSELDDEDQSRQSSRSGPIVEDEGPVERAARRAGWTPLEEWKRDPSKWVDAETYLERTTQENENLRDRLKRTGQAAEAAIEEARRIAKEEALAELRAAAKSGDEEAAVRAADKVAKTSGPDPRTVAWIGRNQWFNADPRAQALAVSVVNARANEGATIEDQLEAAEDEVRKRFPEHFPESRRPPEDRRETPASGERRLSQTERAAPAMAGGSRGQHARPKGEPGWPDIPKDDRAAMSVMVQKMGRQHGVSEQDAQTRLAKRYWDNKGQGQ